MSSMDPFHSNDKDIKRRFNERLRQVLLENPSYRNGDQDPLAVWMTEERCRLRARLEQLLVKSSVLADTVRDPDAAQDDGGTSGLAPAKIVQLREPTGFAWETVFSRWGEEEAG